MVIEKVNEILENIEFEEKGESKTIIEGVNILDLTVDILKDLPFELIEKIEKQLTEVINAVHLLENDFSANCDYCIDKKFHESLSGVGVYKYMQSLEVIRKYKQIYRTRGFEYVTDKHLRNDSKAELPRRGTSKSAGYDFHIPISVTIEPKSQLLIWSDVKAYMLDDEELLLFPRSSMGKHGIVLSNTIAKIDADYYSNEATGGNIGLMIKNTSEVPFTIEKGERVCQGTFSKYLITDDDNPVKAERTGGMGSTGK